MRKAVAWSVVGVLICASLGSADLVTPRKREEQEHITPAALRVYTDIFKANERALVIVSGKGRTCLGMYVFDAAGNCVAKDDITQPITADDLLVEWVTPSQAPYSIEVRNLGHESNDYQIAIR